VQVSDDETAQKMESQGAKLVADYDTFKVYEASTAALESLASDSQVQVRDEDNLIQLNAGAIDTTKSEVQASRAVEGEAFSGKRMHLIQFAGPIKPEWYRALEATGAEVVTYIPSNSYLVYGDFSSLSRVRELATKSHAVQWDGEYKSEYRIDPSISRSSLAAAAKETKSKTGVAAEGSAGSEGFYSIQLVKDEGENANTLALIEKFQLEPIKSQAEVLNYVDLVVRLSADALAELSQRGDVVSVQPWISPTKLDERQDWIISGSLTPTPGDYLAYLASHGFTFTTSTFGVNVSDSGIDNGTQIPNHFGLYALGNPLVVNSRVVYNRLEGTPNPGSTLQGCDGHGNLNTHIVGGYVPTGTVGGVNFNNMTPGVASTLSLGGTYTGGSFSSTRRVTIP